jgi:hypothetical protein
MGFEQIVTKFPWNKIPWIKMLKYAPAIADAASKISDRIKKRFPSPKNEDVKETVIDPTLLLENFRELYERVYELEKNEIEQAELVKKIANQLNVISLGMKVISIRIMIALIGSIVAIILALITLIYSIIK